MLSLRRQRVKKKVTRPMAQECESTLKGAISKNEQNMQISFVASWGFEKFDGALETLDRKAH